MRLDRYLSSITALSRSQARRAVHSGRVSVNGVIIKQPSMPVPEAADVCLDANKLDWPGLRYFMLNKPKGYVCATHDRHNSSALELLAEPVLSGLHFAGRLDKDTTGLVLITDDGAWSHRITAPRRQSPKTYLVGLVEPLSDQAAVKLRRGLWLRSEQRPTRPAKLEFVEPTRIRLTLTEGRYHQVKRMLAAVGNRVIELHRERISSLILDAGLEPGQYRALTEAEIRCVS